MNRKERRAARRQGGGANSPGLASQISRMFALASSQHQSGQLPEAERLYRDILALEPDHIGSLHHLGILAHQLGRADVALDLIGKALALNERIPECHNNLGMVLASTGEWNEAIVHFRRALALQPDNVDASVNLGNVLKEKGETQQAIGCYERALKLRPDFPAAHSNLGAALMALGDHAGAKTSYERALKLDPNFGEALTNMGNWLIQAGQPAEAAGYFERALRLNPDSPDAHNNLGMALLADGNLQEAIARFQGALKLNPDFGPARNNIATMFARLTTAIEADGTPQNKALFVWAASALTVVPDVAGLRALTLRALNENWGRSRDLIPLSMGLIGQNDAIAAAMRRANEAWPRRLSAAELFGPDGLATTAADELLLPLLRLTHTLDVRFERFLAAMRSVLLDTAQTAETLAECESLVPLACALAQSCFDSEYVLDFPQVELDRAKALRDEFGASPIAPAVATALRLAALAAYLPLSTLPASGTALAGHAWPQPVAALIEQQVRGPALERAYRASMPVLTPIENEVSLQVQAQYEDNPYPRWSGVPEPVEPTTLDKLLRAQFPTAPLRAFGKDAVDYLIAGCGTQQAIDVALSLPDARIVAVDLSLSSLCYSKRIAVALGRGDIEFGQADIMQLGSLGRTFNVIDSMGVLHHLADPWAGWRVLVSQLRPGGVMRLGFYSEIGRADIVAARDFAAKHGFDGRSAADIRKYREEFIKLPQGHAAARVVELADFFSVSECRDLLFHVQEHRMKLPQIKKFIDSNGLALIGLSVPEQVRRRYAREFPADIAMTNLDNWHVFETANPRTFLNMYEFWVQSKA